MARKTSSKSTAKKFSAVPPKAAVKAVETVKPVMAAIPAAAVVATPAETKTATIPVVAAAKTETTPVVVAKTECCQATAAATADTACTKHSAAFSAAIESLHGADADAARDAATALGTLGDRTAVEPLVQALNNTCGYFHSVVRAAAAESLGTLADTRAIEPLLGALTDPIAEVSAEAIRALSMFKTEEVIDALSDVVRNRAGFFLPIARRAAVFGLAKIGGERATEILRSVAADEFEDSTIRSAAETGVETGATASKE